MIGGYRDFSGLDYEMERLCYDVEEFRNSVHGQLLVCIDATRYTDAAQKFIQQIDSLVMMLEEVKPDTHINVPATAHELKSFVQYMTGMHSGLFKHGKLLHEFNEKHAALEGRLSELRAKVMKRDRRNRR
jgi:hypothetical protein